MEKHEARLKCSGCGASYKIKVPVTDKAVNFQCKKCGKMLKVRVKLPEASSLPASQPSSITPSKTAPGDTALPGLETSQLPDLDEFDDMPAFEDDLAGSPKKSPPPGSIASSPASRPISASSSSDKNLDEVGLPQFEDNFATSDPTMQVLDPDRLREQAEELERLRKQREAELERKRKETLEAESGKDSGSLIETGYEAQINPAYASGSPAGLDMAKASQVPIGGPAHATPSTGIPPDKDKRWFVLFDGQVQGPYFDKEIVTMINEGEIGEDTSLRMGQRPWIKASQIGEFKKFFGRGISASLSTPLASISLVKQPPATPEPAGVNFSVPWAELFPYPLRGGSWQPVAIFWGITFLSSALLSLLFLPGFLVSLVVWIFLYGYLGQVMTKTMESPNASPPSWDFSRIKELLRRGFQIFVVLALFSLLPVSVCVLVMITAFLNFNDTLGWIFLVLTVVVYGATLLVVPAVLVPLGKLNALAAALNPREIINVIKEGGRAYLMLAGISLGLGLICMVGVLAAVFLADIPAVGFAVAGFVLALFLTYAHFVWFHVLGRFARATLS